MEQTTLFEEPPAMEGAANFSECGLYRYSLTRTWDATLPRVCFIMLNPSTADARTDDPTIRRCLDFTRRWGYGRYIAVNLFALRSPDPGALKKAGDPIGPENRTAIAVAGAFSDLVVCAWGTHGGFLNRDAEVKSSLALACPPGKVKCLGLTKDGHPRHPLYLPKETAPVEFNLEKQDAR